MKVKPVEPVTGVLKKLRPLIAIRFKKRILLDKMVISGLRQNACQKPREFCVISKQEIPIYIIMSEIKRTKYYIYI